ncbi:MAG: hypothetical protein NZM37_04390, partial [Sandaracinaceae bacterium]|nr:hypothetical protein [Sandaracinaceae bacterium]
MRQWSRAWVLLWACLGAACGEGRRPVRVGDSGSDVSLDAPVFPDAAPIECTRNEDCPDDGVFCNGVLVCRDGRCLAGGIPSCDDGITCTVDRCDAAMDRCIHVPDRRLCPSDAFCHPTRGCITEQPCEFDTDCADDGIFCNGPETCVMGVCRSAGRRDCDDGNSCTVDTCSEEMRMCVSTPYPDHLTNIMHCGSGANDCRPCPLPPDGRNQVALCVNGACQIACMRGFVDLDGNMDNGCEYPCKVMGGVDLPDDDFRDTNCDGIDGDRMRAVFVAPSGDDANDGLSPDRPLATLRRALQVAQETGRDQVLVVSANHVLGDTLDLVSGVSIYGGYEAGFRNRTNSRATLTSSAEIAVRAQGLRGGVTIDRVNIVTMDRSSGEGRMAVGLFVRDSGDHLRLRWVNVIAGRGGAGADGRNGARGRDGGRGMDAVGQSGGAGGSPGGGMGASGRYRMAGPMGQAGEPGSCGM